MSVGAQFVLARGISSTVIQLAGGGTKTLGFSHVDIVIPPKWLLPEDGIEDNKPGLLGARSDSIGGKPPGVQIRPWDYGKSTWIRQVYMELESTPAQEAAFFAYAKDQIGKPYDKLAIIAFFIARNWRDQDAWFCDELLLACTEQAGLCPELYLPVNKFNPTTAAAIWSAIGAKRTNMKESA